MKNRILSIAVACLAVTMTAFSQTKLDMSLNHIVSRHHVEMAKSKNKSAIGTKKVSVIAKLNDGETLPEAELRRMGVSVGSVYGSFVTMMVPVSRLEELSEMDEFSAIEKTSIRSLMNQRSQTGTHASAVNSTDSAKTAGLPQAYTGKGVVVGVIDKGIDFNHVNFIDPVTHRTRIKDALLYRNYILGDLGYDGNYLLLKENGDTIKSTDEVREDYTLETDIDTLTTDSHTTGHGTHTASTAAGSYNGDYLDKDGAVNYSGVRGTAYEADLILAGVPDLLDNFIYDAFNCIDKRAEELNEPLVVNCSFGKDGDWLDGKTLACQFLDQFTDNGNRKGVVVCVSAANDGESNCSLNATLDDSNNRTIRTMLDYKYESPTNKYLSTYLNIWSKDKTPFTVSLEFYKPDSLKNYSIVDSLTWDEAYLKQMGYYSANFYDNHDGRYAGSLWTPLSDSIAIGTLMPVIAIHSEKDCTVRLFNKTCDDISGSYNATKLSALKGTDCIAGNSDYSVVSECCTNSILSIGNWRMIGHFYNYRYDSIPDYHHSPFGDICPASSYCEADDNGFQRPDCAAPGASIISGWNSYDEYQWYKGKSRYKICGVAKEEYREGHTSLIAGDSGTSMACPNAVGVIALWLQANPELTVNEIRKILRDTCDNDQYTAASPARFGAGKINALKGLQYILKDMATSIRDVSASSSSDTSRYNISGQKVRPDYRGIVISNGKKYLQRG